MSERPTAPLFIGLTRAPRKLGLPLSYLVLWLCGSMLVFLAMDSAWVLLPSLITYGVLRVLAEREPHLFEIWMIVVTKTPLTWTRRIWGGDSYSA